MKRLYARLVLWLIRPALEQRSELTQVDLERMKDIVRRVGERMNAPGGALWRMRNAEPSAGDGPASIEGSNGSWSLSKDGRFTVNPGASGPEESRPGPAAGS